MPHGVNILNFDDIVNKKTNDFSTVLLLCWAAVMGVKRKSGQWAIRLLLDSPLTIRMNSSKQQHEMFMYTIVNPTLMSWRSIQSYFLLETRRFSAM